MTRVDWLITELNVSGGAENFVARVVPLLRDAGWDVHIITLQKGGKLIDELRAQKVPVTELGVKNKADLGLLPRLIHYWRIDPPDLIHTHLYHAGLLGRLAGYFLGIKRVVVHQHGVELGRSSLRSLLDRATAGYTSQYVASCQAVAKILTQREGIPASKIKVIYNGLEASAFCLPDNNSLPPPGWPVADSQAQILGCVGRLSPEKGQSTFIAAMNQPALKMLNVHAVLIGGGPGRMELENLVHSLNLNGRVHFMGEQPSIDAWLPHFNVFVLPSQWEGVSLALLEAMAAGLPIVATAVGGTPEVMIDGQTGSLVPANNPQALALSCARLLSDPILSVQMGVAGQQRVKSRFTIDQTVREIGQLYQTLL